VSMPSGPSIIERMVILADGHPFGSRVDQSEDGPIPEADGGHRRPLPWGSVPFGGISTGDRVAALPRLRHPPTGFHTLPAAFSHPSLVALFHATSTHRILVFRAFPSTPAAISLDTRCSPVVTPAAWFHRLPDVPLGPCCSPSASPIVDGVQPRARVAHLCLVADFIFVASDLRQVCRRRVARALQRVDARSSPGSCLTPAG